MANILILQAHPESESFSSALAKTYRDQLVKDGHTVAFKDLYALGFDPVSGRNNFVEAHDPAYFKQQVEERHATANAGFVPDLEQHIRDLEACDALIFSFPLWWFSMPAILKGWVDRVFAAGRIYGGSKLYEGGVGQARKRARILMTTGGPNEHYDGWGLNPPIANILSTIEHGIFWFNGFLPLPATVAYSAGHWSQEERAAFLVKVAEEASRFFADEPRQLPRITEFEGTKKDTRVRTRVELRLRRERDEAYRAKLDEERAYLRELKRTGKLLDFKLSEKPRWVAYLDLRTADLEEARALVDGLPLTDYFQVTIQELDPVVL